MSTAADTLREPLLTSDQVAAHFGVTTRTLARWRARGLIRAVRVNGGTVRFRREDVEALVREGREEPLLPSPRTLVVALVILFFGFVGGDWSGSWGLALLAAGWVILWIGVLVVVTGPGASRFAVLAGR